MIPELIGAVGLVFAAVITGIFHRMRRENDAAHGESIAKLEDNGRTTARSTRPQVPFCATGRVLRRSPVLSISERRTRCTTPVMLCGILTSWGDIAE